MVFRHTLMLRFTDDATADQKQAVLDGLASMPQRIDVIRRYEFGIDLGLGDGNPDLALVADFDSEDDWRTYSNHPDHLAMIKSAIAPVAKEAFRVQYEVG